MSTEKQRAASRANGAKSKGPVTPEGKAASSKNALSHGLTAATHFVFPHEDPAAAGLMLDSYVASLQPRGAVETDLAREVAVARWRLLRAAKLEADLVEMVVAQQREEVDLNWDDPDQDARVTFAMEKLLSGPTSIIDRFGRYETRLRRYYTRALQELLALQKRRGEESKNEPGGPQTPPNQQTESTELSDTIPRIPPVDRPVGTVEP